MSPTDAPPYDPRFDEPDPPPPRAKPNEIPHDTDAEEAVLGAMLLSLDACDHAIGAGLTAEHFYAPRHSTIFTATLACLTAGETPDPITVSARIPAVTRDDSNYLIHLQVATPSTTSATTYATRIINTARARHLHAQAALVAATAKTGNLDLALDQLHTLTTQLPDDDTDTSWAPLDLAAVFDGESPAEPTMLARDDGLCLLYAGKVHAFNAESESGKSWLALWACSERLLAGEHVLYLDFEDDATAIIGRLQAFGLNRSDIEGRFHYARPADRIDAVATATLERMLLDHRPTLAIIDGVTEVMAQNGWSINDNDDIAHFLLALPKRIARHGPAVVLIDHVTKDKEQRGRYGIGGQHKLAGIDGAAYHLEVTAPFGIGRNGATRINVTKDRPGHVRGRSFEGRFVGELQVQSLPEGAVHLSLTAHAASGGAPPRMRPTNLMEQVSKAVAELNETGVEPTKNAVASQIPSKKANVLIALESLVSEKYLQVVPGPNRAQTLRSLRPYRQAFDPGSDAFVGTVVEGEEHHDEEF